MNDNLLLIEDCIKGDRRAQERLFREHYQVAMRIALRYSRDEQDAADIVSQAFMKLFRSLGTYDSFKGSFPAWMKRIVINEGLDHIRRRTRITIVEVSDFIEESPIDSEVGSKIDATHIMEFVRQLPAATHAVFVLYVVDGYLHREIAEMLTISEGTSKWHLSEARRILKQKIFPSIKR